MRAKEFITEAFDQPYSFKWEKGEESMDALAQLPDGSNLSIMFNQDIGQGGGDDVILVEFYRNNSQEVTGEGDAQRIFSTVLAAIQQYINKYKPQKLIFSAMKDLDPYANYGPNDPKPNPESRAKLYDRLVQRYARAWGYRAFRADTGSIVRYELSRLRSAVTERKQSPLEDFEGLQFRMVNDNGQLFVNALDSTWGNELGHVTFNIGDGKDLDPQDLFVKEKFQGQGIARIMYDFVKSKGYTIQRSWDQTDAGAGFWDKHRGEERVWEQGVAEGYKHDYLSQISKLIWKPVSRSIWNTIQDEGLDEEQDAPDHINWVMASLSIDPKDAQALQAFDNNAIEDFNRFDIHLKSRYPGLTDLIDYDRGTVTIVKPINTEGLAENFADGRNPQDKGDSQRHGIPKNATMAELEKASHAKGRKGQLARWQLNMRRGHKK